MTAVERAQQEYPAHYQNLRILADGRAVWIQRKIFTHAITVGKADDDTSIENHWCYETKDQAAAALAQWDPMTQEEPDGWFRNPQTGRRRPNGDAAREHKRA
jgi:hypothetical protein